VSLFARFRISKRVRPTQLRPARAKIRQPAGERTEPRQIAPAFFVKSPVLATGYDQPLVSPACLRFKSGDTTPTPSDGEIATQDASVSVVSDLGYEGLSGSLERAGKCRSGSLSGSDSLRKTHGADAQTARHVGQNRARPADSHPVAAIATSAAVAAPIPASPEVATRAEQGRVGGEAIARPGGCRTPPPCPRGDAGADWGHRPVNRTPAAPRGHVATLGVSVWGGSGGRQLPDRGRAAAQVGRGRHHRRALARHDLRPEDCNVVEDSERGLAAVTTAGLPCLIVLSD
jgi:hypothetical protein